MFMKNKVHGGTKGFLQAAANLEKFMRYLHSIPTPFTNPMVNYLECNLENTLWVDNKGHLKMIDKRCQLN
jgi:hypothetical protein